jgi:hypothetical protein
MAKFEIKDFELARVPADTPAVEASEKRWPSACWIRLGPEVVFLRRPKGVALAPFMASLKRNLENASAITAGYLAHRDGVPPDATLPPIGAAMPYGDVAEGLNCSAVMYRNFDGRHGHGPRIVLGSPDPLGAPIVLEGATAPLETGPS